MSSREPTDSVRRAECRLPLSMAAILFVCTGNVCRSPLAEGFLRAELRRRFGDGAPSVASAGTSGWEGSTADPRSAAVAAEHGVDISGHRARVLNAEHLDDAVLVLAMATEHLEDIAEVAPHVASRSFTLKQFVRLLEAMTPPAPGDDPSAQLSQRVEGANALRRSDLGGDPRDQDVADPLGRPLETFRAVAAELRTWCRRLEDALFGQVPAPTGTHREGG